MYVLKYAFLSLQAKLTIFLLRIWLEETHPFNPPKVCVCPTSYMRILEGKYVDGNGRVSLPYLHKWKHVSRGPFLHVNYCEVMWEDHIVGLEQDCSNSSALAMELPQHCTKPSTRDILVSFVEIMIHVLIFEFINILIFTYATWQYVYQTTCLCIPCILSYYELS